MIIYLTYYISLVVLTLALLLFNMYHLMLIINNMTTYEYSITCKTENNYKYYYDNIHFKYFISYFSNIKMVLGENIFFWCLPIKKHIIKANINDILKDNYLYTDETLEIIQDEKTILSNSETSFLNEYFRKSCCNNSVYNNGLNFKLNQWNELEAIKNL